MLNNFKCEDRYLNGLYLRTTLESTNDPGNMWRFTKSYLLKMTGTKFENKTSQFIF